MSNTIAEYYADELVDWNHAITFYDEELEILGKKLGEVLRRNSIVDIAGKVEAQQKSLDKVSEKFYKLKVEFEQQEEVLRTDSTFIDNTFINADTEKRQDEYRNKMLEAEKEYIEAKFDCYHFLSGTLKK
jgi:hypothetical protein